MRDSLYLAWQYLRHHRFTSALLISSLSLILYLPAALQTIVTNAEIHFRARADTTSLIIGPRGSSLELVLGSLYFDKPSEQSMRLEQLIRIDKQELATAIPLHTKFTARDCQIVGTNLNYISERNLRVAVGRQWQILGECLIGARVADRLEVEVGDRIPVSTSNAFVLDSPPLRLRVTGILATSETPDDEAIFASLETTWIIEGLGHGHAAEAEHGSPAAELYTDITTENVDSFHFHGRREQFPITSILVTPQDERAETILRGQYFSADETVQIAKPREVMDSLLEKVIMVRSYMVVVIAVVSIVTLFLFGLIIVLSIRLRRGEILTMSKIGCSRYRITSMLGCQIAIIFLTSLAVAAAMTVLTNEYGTELVRILIL